MIPKKAMKWIIGFNVLNIVDVLLTLWLVHTLGAVEINPLMALLIYNHPIIFVLVKLSVGFGCTLMLIKKKAFGIFIICTWIYIIVAIWNLNQFYFNILGDTT